MPETTQYSEYFISMMENREYDCGHAPTTDLLSDEEIIEAVEVILSAIDNEVYGE